MIWRRFWILAAWIILTSYLIGRVCAENCSAPNEWFPKTPQPDNHEPRPGDSCDFYKWAWQTFLYSTQSEQQGGEPRFVGYDTPLDLFGQHATLSTLLGPRKMLRLTPLSAKQAGPTNVDTVFQATTNGVLVDGGGRAVYYGMHVNDVFSKFVISNGFNDGLKIKDADAGLVFPVGTIELKSSWRILQASDDASQFYKTDALVPVLVADAQGHVHIDPNAAPRHETVALVGVHVVGVTEEHPEFIWATFEHHSNAPDLPAGTTPSPSDDVSGNRNWTFCPAGVLANQCNINNRNTLKLIDPTAQTLDPKVPVFRMFAFGGDADSKSIQDLNNSVHASMPANLAVWKNYDLIGAVWLKHIHPVKELLDQHQKLNAGDEAGSLHLANVTMETFSQNQNCFQCHDSTEQHIPNSPTILAAKNINLSHILVNAFAQAVQKPAPSQLAILHGAQKAMPTAETQETTREDSSSQDKSKSPVVAQNSKAMLIVASILLLILLIALIATCAGWPGVSRLDYLFFFWLGLFYLVLLVALAFLYAANAFNIKATIPVLLAGILPVAVPWFGAVGAVVISLEGVFKYNETWKKKYNFWHAARPLTGAVLGSIAFFMLLLINLASSTPPNFIEKPEWKAKDVLIYCILAFLVGYREETFRVLIAKVTDVILGPGEKPPPDNGNKPDGDANVRPQDPPIRPHR